jgi:hypothetical protein
MVLCDSACATVCDNVRLCVTLCDVMRRHATSCDVVRRLNGRATGGGDRATGCDAHNQVNGKNLNETRETRKHMFKGFRNKFKN